MRKIFERHLNDDVIIMEEFSDFDMPKYRIAEITNKYIRLERGNYDDIGIRYIPYSAITEISVRTDDLIRIKLNYIDARALARYLQKDMDNIMRKYLGD